MTSQGLPGIETSDRLVYDDTTSVLDLQSDARRCRARLERVATTAVRPAPDISYAAWPREVAKREITISAAAQRLAASLQLHLD